MATAKKSWGVLLFASIFASVGLGLLIFSVIPTLAEWQSMKSWPSAEATVTASKLEYHRGDDSTTFEATAQYEYAVNGTYYQSSRVGISSGSDNIGKWHQSIAATLRRARDSQRSITIYYDSSNPSDAIIDRDLRWGLLGFKLIFVLVFGGIGVGIFCWSKMKKAKVINHPEASSKPWLGHESWQRTVLSDAKSSLYVSWGFALFWNLISLPICFVIPEEIKSGNYPALIALLFPLVGVFLLRWAIKTTQRWRLIGPTPLTLDPYPGSIGGQVGGTIATSIPYQQFYRFPVTLCCIYSYMSGSGKNRSRKESIKWQGQGYAEVEPASNGLKLLFCFDVPEGLPESELSASSYNFWRLNLKSEQLPTDMDRSFILPVFNTATKSEFINIDSSAHPLAQEKREEQIESVMNMTPIQGGAELFFPMFRNAKSQLIGVLFGAIFLGAGIGIGYAEGPFIFPVIFGGIGGAIVIGCLYSLFNSLRVRLDRNGITTQRYLLGLSVGQQKSNNGNIKELCLHEGGSMSSGNEHTVFYSIKAHLHSGKKITIAESLIGQAAAEQTLDTLAMLSGYKANNKPIIRGQEFAERKLARQNKNK